MATEQKVIHLGAVAYPITFSSNALYRLEKETKYTIEQLGYILLSGRGGYMHLQQILWSGLEGARLKMMTRPVPYTMDEVGDLIDLAGGAPVVWDEDGTGVKELLEAWHVTFPVKRANEDPPKNEKAAARKRR